MHIPQKAQRHMDSSGRGSHVYNEMTVRKGGLSAVSACVAQLEMDVKRRSHKVISLGWSGARSAKERRGQIARVLLVQSQ